MHRLPTFLISHGSPMHALDPGGAGRARHDTIHDFSGFPAPLSDLRYGAPGAAERIHASVEGAALSMGACRFH